MANELSTGTSFASLFGPSGIITKTGTPVGQTPVTVYQSDGATLATLYTDQTRVATASNPVNTDTYGNLTFYTNPGIYVLSFSIGGVANAQTVQVAPWYSNDAWNVVNDTADSGGSAFAPLSGDSRICNAAAGNATYTLPAAAQGSRLLFTRTDATGSTCVLNAPSGTVILGPALGSGSPSFSLRLQGQSVELHGDGTNFHVVGGGSGGGELAFGSRVAITTANTWQTVASYTPDAAGRFLVGATLEIPSGGASAAVQVTFTDEGGAQTVVIYPTGQGTLAQGVWSSLTPLIDANAAAIAVQVQSSSTATLATAMLRAA